MRFTSCLLSKCSASDFDNLFYDRRAVANAVSEPIKHHFVPQFYLRGWAANDGRIPFCMRANSGALVTGSVMPDATAFENSLYSFEKVPKEKRQEVEKKFFAEKVDSRAAPVMAKLLRNEPLTQEERIDWAVFLIASRLRIPEIVKNLKKSAPDELRKNLVYTPEELESLKGDLGDDPPTLLEWTEKTFVGLIDNSGMMMLPSIITDPEHIDRFLKLTWWVRDVRTSSVSLLTADRPVWVWGGINSPVLTMALPLSPTKLFLATRSKETREASERWSDNRLARLANESLVRQADRFVYGDAVSAFVGKHLRMRP